MKTAKLIRNKYHRMDLVIDGVVYGDNDYNFYRLKNCDVVTVIDMDNCEVSDVDAFLAWANVPAAETVRIIGVEDGYL